MFCYQLCLQPVNILMKMNKNDEMNKMLTDIIGKNSIIVW